MAGLSRSEYRASIEKKKSNKLKTVLGLVWMLTVLVFLPQLIIFSIGFWIALGLLLGSVKAGIDLPDFR